MRYLIPEIASPIGFIVTLVLFCIFSFIVFGVIKKGKVGYKQQENLPFSDD